MRRRERAGAPATSLGWTKLKQLDIDLKWNFDSERRGSECLIWKWCFAKLVEMFLKREGGVGRLTNLGQRVLLLT